MLAVTANDTILETERGNSNPSSNLQQKRETQTEPLSRKKKIALTGDSMVNGISEKGLSVNHKVKIVNFPSGTHEKILEKLDEIIKEKPDDLIVHVGTNDITNNVNFFDQRQKIYNKISKESPLTFSSIINGKGKTNIQKILKGNSAFAKYFIASYEQDRLIFFPYDLVTVNDCLSDTLKKQNLVRILGCKLYVRIISVN